MTQDQATRQGCRQVETGDCVTCPHCGGAGKSLAFWDGEATHGGAELACPTCNGTGEVSLEHARRIAEGWKRRQDRLARGLTLAEEARRLGITPAALSRIERGRAL